MYLSDLPLASDACWIWAPDVSGPNRYVEFYQTVDLSSMPAEAWIQLSAETSLRLFINGKLVHSGPPREVPPYFYFDTVDLRSFLKIGQNEILILAHHLGVNSQSYQAGTPAILVAGHLGNINFTQAEKWKARTVARYQERTHRLCSCVGFAEEVDFAAKEAPWSQAIEIARHPWSERPTALNRDLPFCPEEVRPSATTTRQEEGWLIDFGTETSGYVELTLRADHPMTIQVSYAEELQDGKVHPDKSGLAYYDVLKLPDGTTSWRSYEKRAFRYMHLNQPAEVLKAQVIEQMYPYKAQYRETKLFQENENSDEGRLINRILDVSARTIELNTEDLLTDCPWRERAQYFDCYFYMEAMLQLFGTLEPIRRFLNQFPRGADATGLLRMCYPSPSGTDIIPDFSISYATHLKQYLELSGDRETVERNLPFADRGVTAFRQYEDEENLLTEVPGWIFIDNTFELSKFPRSAALNAVYHGGHLSMAEMYRIFGQEKRATEFEDHAKKIRIGFRRAFVREDRVLDSDSTPQHEAFRYWNYHFSAETGKWQGKSFRLRTRFRTDGKNSGLRLAVNSGGRAWIDGKLAMEIEAGGSWRRSALFQPISFPLPTDAQYHQLDLEVEWNGIDWECYLSSRENIEWDPILVWEETAFETCLPDSTPSNAFSSRLRHYSPPWMTQATVGHAAFHGLLEPDKAQKFLRACLPQNYTFPFAKRTTPFFAQIDDSPDPRRILPCNVPASMFHFCHALRRHGMEEEAKKLLLPIYSGMLERGATTWWEEWNTRSSLCHAWASFAAVFFTGKQQV